MGNSNCAKILLDAGACIKSSAVKGLASIDIPHHIIKTALEQGDFEFMSYVIHKCPEDVKRCSFLLDHCIVSGKLEVVTMAINFMVTETLESQGVNSEATVNAAMAEVVRGVDSAFYKAIKQNKYEIVKLLAEGLMWWRSQYFLAYALENPDLDPRIPIFIVEYCKAKCNGGWLFNTGKDYEGQNCGGSGKTPVRIVVENLAKFKDIPKHYDKQFYMLYCMCYEMVSAYYTIPDMFGNPDLPDQISSLYIAVEHGMKDVIKLLLYAGANPNIECAKEDGVSKTPLVLAREKWGEDSQITHLLENSNSEAHAGIRDEIDTSTQEGRGRVNKYHNQRREDLKKYYESKDELSRDRGETGEPATILVACKTPEPEIESLEKRITQEYKILAKIDGNHKGRIELGISNIESLFIEFIRKIDNDPVIEDRFQNDFMKSSLYIIRLDPYKNAFLESFKLEMMSSYTAAMAVYSGIVDHSRSGDMGRLGELLSLVPVSFVSILGGIMKHLDHNQQSYNISHFSEIASDYIDMREITTLAAIKILNRNLRIEENSESFIQKVMGFFGKIEGVKISDIHKLLYGKNPGASQVQKTEEQIKGEKAGEIAAKLIIIKICAGAFTNEIGDIQNWSKKFDEWVTPNFEVLDNPPQWYSRPLILEEIVNTESGEREASEAKKSFLEKIFSCFHVKKSQGALEREEPITDTASRVDPSLYSSEEPQSSLLGDTPNS